MRPETALLLALTLLVPVAAAFSSTSGYLTLAHGTRPHEDFHLGSTVLVHVTVRAGSSGATVYHRIALTRNSPDPFAGTWSDGTSTFVHAYRTATVTFAWNQTADGGVPVPRGDYTLTIPVQDGATERDVTLHADLGWGPDLQVASLAEPGRASVYEHVAPHENVGPYDVGGHAAGVVVLQACVTVTVPAGEEPLNTTAFGLAYLRDGGGTHVVADHVVNTTTARPCGDGGYQDTLVWDTALGATDGSPSMTTITAVVDPLDHVVESNESNQARSIAMPFAGVSSSP